MTRTVLIGLSVLLLALGLALAGCGGGDDTGGDDETAMAPTTSGPATTDEPADGPTIETVAGVTGGPVLAVIGNKTDADGNYICPVSENALGSTLDELEKRPYVNYKDKTYYVNCPNCEARFSENPEGFVKGTAVTCAEGGCEAAGECAEHDHGTPDAGDESATPAEEPAETSA
ncbi:MAG: hypothetical protein GF320_08340 [Armatimonadia bacterium]|nr:hypothetical protein [Armatimonadia bacterium]